MKFDNLKEIGIKLNFEQEMRLEKYIELFEDFNQKINLMSSKDINFLYEKHIYDSLAFNLFVQKYGLNDKIKMLDIGTGGGLPSVPISILYKDINVCALDSTAKKIKFIELIKQKLDIKNINPVSIRAEELPEELKNSFDIVTSRAMAELRIILEYSIPFLKKNGYFIAYKSIKAEEEIENARNALKILNAQIIDKIEYNLPLSESVKRVLIVIKKTGDTPAVYPRQNGLIKKKPL